MTIWYPGTAGAGGGGRRSRQSKIYDACGNQLQKGYPAKKKPPAIVEPSPRTGNSSLDVKNGNTQPSGDVLAPLGPPQPRSILKKRDTSLVVPNRRSLVKTHSLEMEDAYAVPAKRVTKQQLLEGSKSAAPPPKPTKSNRPKSAMKAQTPPTPVRANRGSAKPNSSGGGAKSADSDQMSSSSSNAASERRQARRDREVVLTPVMMGDKLNNNNNSNNNLTADGRPKSFMKKLFLMQ